jgi:type IV secretion system protein VirD4
MKLIEEIFLTIINILEASVKFIFEFIEVAITGIPKKNESYNAQFASSGILLSRRANGFCLTGRRNLSVKNSYQNALVIGGTGTGKSSIVLLPSIYTMQSSFIIHDPSGELYTKSAGCLNERGYEVKVLNFAKPEISSGYNPLSRAKTSSDIQKIASMLVENAFGGKGKDPFWNAQAIGLLSMLIAILKTQNEEFQNLYNIRQLLNQLGGDPKGVDSLFSRYADEILFSEYKAFLAYDDKVINGVIATTKAALQNFSDESIAKVTSHDTINFEIFRRRPVALFIQNSIADQKYYAVLTSIFFEQFFSYLLSHFPKENELDIFLLIDETASLNLPTLPLAVANVRKHRAGIMLLLQDFNQLVHNYGKYDADAIKANCFAKLFFTGQSLETTKELEQTLGKFEFENKEGHKVVRSLMTNDEIRMMKASQALLICGHHKPILVRLKPFYKINKLKTCSEIVAPQLHGEVNSEALHILPLKYSRIDAEEV